jgi:hypothetical protein
MTTLTEGVHNGEFLLHEEDGSYSRTAITIAAAAPAMASGTLLGKITASGKYAAYANGNADGTETCAGVLLNAVPDSAADQKAVMINRVAEVMTSRLTGLDSPGTADLLAIGVVVR